MLLSQALDTVLKFSPKEFAALSDLLSPETSLAEDVFMNSKALSTNDFISI